MFEYYFMLLLSVLMLVGSIFSIRYYAIKKKKSGNTYVMPMKDKFIVIAFSLLSFILFLYTVRFLPAVILNQTDEYKGDCEIYIYDNARGGGLQVYFDEKNISFYRQGYSVEQEGNYYCQVEYYHNSEIGKTIMIYESEGGKIVKPKKQY
ncbi:hypothetical protein WQ54_07810 [Bacillus sp. SA1-12]|uniref:hypothetical protein n=1 Tax=Bacillus sp. SA1-12 TaxID=1455638 RepID=UPI0006265AE0|nr:hypothetical protein [Bacillus sp. SA1-12]KKI92774.1 hypothetical protein WQ54_07810 [Bacillus sp. SA1-12]